MRTKKERLELAQRISVRTNDSRCGMWIKNLVYNEENIKKGKKLQEYYARIKGAPVIIVGAGPSLDKNIKYLKAVKNRAFIMCTDTAYKAVKNVVTPNSVVILEGRKEQKEVIFGNDFKGTENIILFAECTSSPDIAKSWKGEVIWYTTGVSGSEALSRNLEKDFNDGKPIGRISAGGCVTNAAFSIAKEYLRADPIILVGVDCGFYNTDKLYCKEQEEDQEKKLILNGLEMEEDVYGEPILTTKVMQMYRYWIEDMIASRNSMGKPNYEGIFINATEGGTIKRNWVPMRLQTVAMAYLPNKYNFNNFNDLKKEIKKEDKKPKRVNMSMKFNEKDIEEATEIEND